MLGTAANITIGSEAIVIDICGENFKIPLDKLDTFTMRDLGRFTLTAWKNREEREIKRKSELVKEFMNFGEKE